MRDDRPIKKNGFAGCLNEDMISVVKNYSFGERENIPAETAPVNEYTEPFTAQPVGSVIPESEMQTGSSAGMVKNKKIIIAAAVISSVLLCIALLVHNISSEDGKKDTKGNDVTSNREERRYGPKGKNDSSEEDDEDIIPEGQQSSQDEPETDSVFTDDSMGVQTYIFDDDSEGYTDDSMGIQTYIYVDDSEAYTDDDDKKPISAQVMIPDSSSPPGFVGPSSSGDTGEAVIQRDCITYLYSTEYGEVYQDDIGELYCDLNGDLYYWFDESRKIVYRHDGYRDDTFTRVSDGKKVKVINPDRTGEY